MRVLSKNILSILYKTIIKYKFNGKGIVSMIQVKKKRVSREYLANPFPNKTYNSRLLKSKSIDLKENCVFEDFGNGYSKITAIDKNKLIKVK